MKARLLLAGLLVALTSVARAEPELPSWRDGTARQTIVDFVRDVTSQGSKDFVAPETAADDARAGDWVVVSVKDDRERIYP